MGQPDHFLEAGPTSLMRSLGPSVGRGSKLWLWLTVVYYRERGSQTLVSVTDQAPATDQLCRLGQVT